MEARHADAYLSKGSVNDAQNIPPHATRRRNRAVRDHAPSRRTDRRRGSRRAYVAALSVQRAGQRPCLDAARLWLRAYPPPHPAPRVNRRIRHVDAFTATPLEGNPAAVVDGEGLSGEVMQ